MGTILDKNPLLNCSQYGNDYQIIRSFPFLVQLNPYFRNPDITFAFFDDHENVNSTNLVNQQFVPLSMFCFKHLSQRGA